MVKEDPLVHIFSSFKLTAQNWTLKYGVQFCYGLKQIFDSQTLKVLRSYRLLCVCIIVTVSVFNKEMFLKLLLEI